MGKKKKWLKYRHKVVRNVVCAVLSPVARLKYGIRVEKFKEAKRRQYLIVYNHQTAFDQFFVGMTVSGPIYYLASEDLFSKGFVSSLIRYLVAPIPIKKQTTDVTAVINCMRVAREGGTIAIAPEGNRTYSGKTEYINPSIAMLAHKLKLPIAFVRIEGGYGVQPRWSDVTRSGNMKAYVSKVLEPEQYAALSNEELLAVIEQELYVNEAKADGVYKHKKSAEYLERAIYVCPSCGLSTFNSAKNEISCTKCGMRVRYLPTKELEGVGFDFPFKFVNDWYENQSSYVNRLDLGQYINAPMYNEAADVYEVEVYKSKKLVMRDAAIRLYGNRIELFEGIVLPFEEISAVAVLGRNKLNIYHGGKVYQLKGDKHFNALKYVNIYYRSKNIGKDEADGKFLGL